MGKTAREVLNELRWREPSRIRDAVIFYRDRTRKEGFRTIRGSEIGEVERRYFSIVGARLPYYKIERIEEGGRVLFQRGTQGPGLSPTSDP
ncbi:MAG TPA: RNA repair domain-containing protein [Thermoplasmata archaeon]|jgi:uncharacterized protein (UPF0248 family)|nr:RNA repair domain-containing protein [Thermoplasmata archaeon]